MVLFIEHARRGKTKAQEIQQRLPGVEGGDKRTDYKGDDRT